MVDVKRLENRVIALKFVVEQDNVMLLVFTRFTWG